MKKILCILSLCIISTTGFTQTEALPNAFLKTLDGQSLNLQDLGKSGKITVIVFWTTWSGPCKRALNDINTHYERWQKEYDLELIAISLDDKRSADKVPEIVKEKGWKYRILVQPKEKLNPYEMLEGLMHRTLLLDQSGKIVFEQKYFNPAKDVLELEDRIKELKK
ncbi:MAG: TlpA family protein disulfide reductase [Phycisphaerae bacterium]|nr:TlpA family protein disulfide reductase [Saprospiraceae bacterium]